MDAIEWHEALVRHSEAAKKKNWCEQCQRPWIDGFCTCGHWYDPEVLEAHELAFSVQLVPRSSASGRS